MRVRFTSGSPFIGSPLTVIKLELFSGFAATTQPSADTIFSRNRLEVPQKIVTSSSDGPTISTIPVNSPALPAEIRAKSNSPWYCAIPPTRPPNNLASTKLLGEKPALEIECSVEKFSLFVKSNGALTVVPTPS